MITPYMVSGSSLSMSPNYSPAPATGDGNLATSELPKVVPRYPSPVIRAYLAFYFIYQPWYRSIGYLEATGPVANVTARLTPTMAGKVTAHTICEAILDSHYASRVIVIYSGSRHVQCSQPLRRR
jgi:hypothetical protein